MDITFQTMLNIAIVVCGTLGGWVLGRITKSLDKLDDDDVRQMPRERPFNMVKHGFSTFLPKHGNTSSGYWGKTNDGN